MINRFIDYHEEREGLAKYPCRGEFLGLVYCALALSGETGELADKVKKVWRDHDGLVSDEMRMDLVKEAGDALWYLDALVTELKSSLGFVAGVNIEKLTIRREQGTLHGAGDDRGEDAVMRLNAPVKPYVRGTALTDAKEGEEVRVLLTDEGLRHILEDIDGRPPHDGM